jgi:hypothetical protein
MEIITQTMSSPQINTAGKSLMQVLLFDEPERFFAGAFVLSELIKYAKRHKNDSLGRRYKARS